MYWILELVLKSGCLSLQRDMLEIIVSKFITKINFRLFHCLEDLTSFDFHNIYSSSQKTISYELPHRFKEGVIFEVLLWLNI